MLRIGLTIYLIAATATGPSLCRCSALWSPWFRPTSKPQTAPNAPAETPHACCHHRPAATDAQALQAAGQDTRTPVPCCLCAAARPEVVFTSSARAGAPSPDELLALGHHPLLSHISDPASPALSALNSASGGHCACPGAREALNRRHVLRC
jgi:hypothetical protein